MDKELPRRWSRVGLNRNYITSNYYKNVCWFHIWATACISPPHTLSLLRIRTKARSCLPPSALFQTWNLWSPSADLYRLGHDVNSSTRTQHVARINGGFRCLVRWYGLGEIARRAIFPWCQLRLWDQRNGGRTRIQSVSNTFKITKTTPMGVQERASTERPTAKKPMWS